MPRSVGRVLVGLVVVCLAGCGGDARVQKTHAVKGRVLLDGKPFKGAFVALIPKDASKFVMNERPQATTDGDGNFVLSTYATGDGAPAGDYWVGIDSPNAPAEDDGSDQAVRKKKGAPSIPAKYNTAQKSGLEVTVPAGGTELKPFELTSGK
jgi:hypothetical protein